MTEPHTYDYLIDTYASEQIKTITVWATFSDENWRRRPSDSDDRGRTAEEHFMHQCISENTWFANMLEIQVDADPLPATHTILDFMRTYAHAAQSRQAQLQSKTAEWWQQSVTFFDVPRSRAWVLLRRLTHSAHHRGQLTSMIRAWGLTLYSTYGPTADTGGLAPKGGKTRYAFASIEEAIAAVEQGRRIGDDESLPYTQRTEKPS